VVSQESDTSVTLEVTGYTTTRTLTSMQFQFTASNANLASGSTTIPLNIQSYAQAWFESTQSDSYGGEFVISVPFNLASSSSSSTTSLPGLLGSVSITAANQVGTSNAVTVSFSQ
jgi:hypothetical protein